MENNVTIQKKQEEEKVLDLLDIFNLFLDNIRYLAVFTVLGAVIFGAISFFLIKPLYQSTSKLYIVSASKDTVVDISDLNLGTSLTLDYEELILSYPVLNEVIDKLGLKMDYRQLGNMITIENPDDTRILNLTVTSPDPKEARDIVNMLAKVSVTYLPKTMNTSPPNIAQKGILPARKSSPSYLKYTLFGLFLGLFGSCLFFTVKYMMDDTIHTPQDMEDYFGIIPLTTVPDNEVFYEKENSGKKEESEENQKEVNKNA